MIFTFHYFISNIFLKSYFQGHRAYKVIFVQALSTALFAVCTPVKLPLLKSLMTSLKPILKTHWIPTLLDLSNYFKAFIPFSSSSNT